MRWFATSLMSAALVFSVSALSLAQESTVPSSPSAWNWLKPGTVPPKPVSNPNSTVARRENPSDKLHVIRQTTCNIPFTIDPKKPPPTEMQLYVSQDRGANWKFYAKAQPDAGQFTFRAISDGEFWFALRTVDKKSPPLDPKKLPAGLKVFVDTREPELHFNAALRADGEIHATWNATDPTLAAGSFKIEYQTDPHEPWRTVMLSDRQPNQDGKLTGEYSWRPTDFTDSVIVRAEVSDQAANKAVVSRRLLSQQLADKWPVDSFQPRETISAAQQVAHGGQAWPADNRLPPRPQSNAVVKNAELPPPKPSAESPLPRSNSEPPRKPLVSAPPLQRETFTSTPAPTDIPLTNEIVPESIPSAQEEEITAAPNAQPELNHSPIVRPAPARSAPPETPPSAQTPDPHSASALPNGERPRMTNTRQFSLDYEIDALGPAAVARVELWGTSDGGRSWSNWINDDDLQSPFDVTLDRDGIFGFRIVIVSTNQLASAPPRPGDPADLWVGVDTSRPTVRMTSAMYGEGEQVGKLDIRWQAVDVWFAERPITLQFSESPNGPWSTIAASLPNTGQYLWAVEPRIPRSIYLRIEATDEAGNSAEHLVSEPISTAGLIPQGRIKNLRITPPSSPTGERSAAKSQPGSGTAPAVR